MHRTTIALTALAAIGLAGPAFAKAKTPAEYVKMAGASDLYEKTSSQLVLADSKNTGVRDYAQHMIKDHTKSTAEVKAAAMKAGLHPAPPKLTAMQAGDVAKLRAAHGTARDKLYLQQQKTSHDMALQLQQGYADNGTSAPLKATAATIAPVVKEHIAMLDKMGPM